MNVQMEKELNVVGTTEEKKQQIREFYAQEEKELNKKLYEDKVAKVQKTVSQVLDFAKAGADLMSAIADLQQKKEEGALKKGEKLSDKAQERQFKNRQKLAIVNAIIDTAGATMQAYSKMPDPISASIYAALIAATGAIQIATIAAQKFVPNGSDSSGSGTTSSNIGGVPSTEQTNISTPTLFGLGQFNPANAPSNQQQRVYVLESDITRSQQNVRQVQVSATF
jgi:hypothetical protein